MQPPKSDHAFADNDSLTEIDYRPDWSAEFLCHSQNLGKRIQPSGWHSDEHIINAMAQLQFMKRFEFIDWGLKFGDFLARNAYKPYDSTPLCRPHQPPRRAARKIVGPDHHYSNGSGDCHLGSNDLSEYALDDHA